MLRYTAVAIINKDKNFIEFNDEVNFGCVSKFTADKPNDS